MADDKSDRILRRLDELFAEIALIRARIEAIEEVQNAIADDLAEQGALRSSVSKIGFRTDWLGRTPMWPKPGEQDD